MIKERTNLLVMGTLASGSGALIDMLGEYENINVLRYEFNDFRRPGFVNDQLSYETSISYPNVIDENIRFTNSRWKMIYNSSIWKLIPENTLDAIWERNIKNKKLNAYKNSLTELFQIAFLQELNRDLKSGISFDEKINLANKWIRKAGSIFPSHYDYTLFNQPLHPWSDPAIWTRVFNPFKLIIVVRDPKDQLAEMVKRNITFAPFRNPELSYEQFNITSIYGNDHKGRLKFMKDALLKRGEMLDAWLNKIEPDRILFVDFEGLANNYDVYEKRLERYLGNIEGKHIQRKKRYNPEVAQRNSIGIYKKYLKTEDLEDLSSLEKWYINKLNLGIAGKE